MGASFLVHMELLSTDLYAAVQLVTAILSQQRIWAASLQVGSSKHSRRCLSRLPVKLVVEQVSCSTCGYTILDGVCERIS